MKHPAIRDLAPVLRMFIQQQRKAMIQGGLLAAATALAGTALLGLSGWFLTAAAIAGLSVAAIAAFDVFMPSASIRLLALARTASRYGERVVTHDATLRVLASLRARLFRGWATPGAAGRLILRPARLLFRLTHDIDALDGLYLRVLVPAFAAGAVALVAGVVLGVLNVWLGLGVVAVLIAAGIAIPAAAARSAAANTLYRARMVEANRARTIDLVQGQTDLIMTGRMQAQADAILQADARLARVDQKLNNTEATATLAFGLVAAAVLAGVLLVAGHLVQAGNIGAAPATMAVLLAFAAVEPFGALRRGAMELPRIRMAARRLRARLQDTAPSPEHPLPPAGIAAQLAAVTLAQSGAGQPRLDAINLSVAAGQTVAIIGPSGAGKSSLLAILAQEVTPTSGDIAVAPTALMTQRNQIFADTLRENLRLAAPTASDAALTDAAAAAGLSQLPDGLDTVIGEGGLGLSGGQARRLALARMILRDAPIWLLDEPTEALDSATARDVITQLQRLTADRTVVIATHIRREAAFADRLIVMEGGRIVANHEKASPAFSSALALLRPD